MSERHWIITDGWAGRFAWPCEVLSRGPKYARVKLLAGLKVNGRTYSRGTIKTRIPLTALRTKIVNATEVKP